MAKTADHQLRGLSGRSRVGRVEADQHHAGWPSQGHLSGSDRACGAIHSVLPGRNTPPGDLEAYPAVYVPDGGTVFLVDGHLDRKLCCGVLHDPQLLQACVPKHCHPHCRGAGLPVPGKSHRPVYHQHLHCQHGHHAAEHSRLRSCSQLPVSHHLSGHLRRCSWRSTT